MNFLQALGAGLFALALMSLIASLVVAALEYLDAEVEL